MARLPRVTRLTAWQNLNARLAWLYGDDPYGRRLANAEDEKSWRRLAQRVAQEDRPC